MIEISKELLSEVLGCDIRKTNSSTIDENLYYYKAFVKCKSKINIYELAYKCKEWARDKYDITVSSSLYKNYAKSWDISNDKSYTADTEPEAIIKACEWILKEIKK